MTTEEVDALRALVLAQQKELNEFREERKDALHSRWRYRLHKHGYEIEQRVVEDACRRANNRWMAFDGFVFMIDQGPYRITKLCSGAYLFSRTVYKLPIDITERTGWTIKMYDGEFYVSLNEDNCPRPQTCGNVFYMKFDTAHICFSRSAFAGLLIVFCKLARIHQPELEAEIHRVAQAFEINLE